MEINKEEYLKSPCRACSLPYHKWKNMTLPENMLILHNDDFDEHYLEQYADELYFRLKHDLRTADKPTLPNGFELCTAEFSEYAEHINRCYGDISVTEQEIRACTEHKTYSEDLWIAVKHNNTVVATGIAELDKEIGEGILEWVQVSHEYRGKALGQFIVKELLYRMKGKANFVTVSGQVNNKTNPEVLYRKCGFYGNDVWHILRRK